MSQGRCVAVLFFFRKMQDQSRFEMHLWYLERKRWEKATPEQPRWELVDVGYVRTLKRPLSLTEIREHRDALGEEFALIRTGSRLSVMPVTAAQWKLLLSLE